MLTWLSWQLEEPHVYINELMIYLDNSATTFVRPEVRDAMLPFLSEHGGNPSSIHRPGQIARQAIDTARQQVAVLLNCQPDEVLFTPCATYSNNTAILGRARYADAAGLGKHLITSVIEHPSCLGPAKYLEGQGWSVTYLEVDKYGMISAQDVQRALRPETSLISLMWANNEIGSLFPIAEIGAIARERKIFFHTDVVQAPGKLLIDVEELGADTMSLSGHKFYAPKGIGILYKRRTSQVQPIAWGGGQESALFAGTENVPSIVAIGKAAELAHTELDDVQPRLREMQRLLVDKVNKIAGVRITGPDKLEQRLPGHVSFVVPDVEGEAIVMQCDLKSLYISAASACKKGIKQPSYVVSALGLSDETAMGSIRISAGRFNTIDECEKASETLCKIIEKMSAKAKV